MTRNIILVAIGSGIGGIFRYLTQQFVQNHYPSSFPFGTLLVNILGCFAIGMVYALGDKGNLLTPETRLFLATGICGGFTTYSSFAYENIRLLQDGEFFYTGLYVGISVIIGFTALYLGILLIKIL
ncbi:MAG: fluoride efflux transporter CrcB [Chitinophagaceae bacterium]